MKLNGKYNNFYLLFMGGIFFFSSCKVVKDNNLIEYNRVENYNFGHIYKNFKNDSLKLEIRLINSWGVQNSTQYLSKIISDNLKSDFEGLSKRNLIVQFSNDSIHPQLHTAIFSVNYSNSRKGFERFNYYWKEFYAQKKIYGKYFTYSFDFKDTINHRELLWISWSDTAKKKIEQLQGEVNLLAYLSSLGSNYKKDFVPNPIELLVNLFNYKNIEGGNYLKPIQELNNAKPLFKTEEEIENWKDIYNIAVSRVGLNEEKRNEIGPSSERIDSLLKNGEHYYGSNAMKYLLERCSKNQVVMFNEAHHRPNNRYLVSVLLDSLFKLGFKTLALESIEHETALDNMLPNLDLGWFLAEPQLSNLIRNAKQIGFKIVSYEDTTNSESRELVQANNLIDKTIKQDKNEKIIVLCGYAHIIKDTSENTQKFMAFRFKELTGINPLTINQTTLSKFQNLKDDLIVLDGKQISKFYGWTSDNDIYLMNNITRDKFKIKPQEKDFTLNLKLSLNNSKSKENRFVCLVYFENEYSNFYRVPIFTKIVKKNDELILKLPIGEYVIEVKDVDGQTLFKESHSIKGDN